LFYLVNFESPNEFFHINGKNMYCSSIHTYSTYIHLAHKFRFVTLQLLCIFLKKTTAQLLPSGSLSSLPSPL
jgi:hypothetical protein